MLKVNMGTCILGSLFSPTCKDSHLSNQDLYKANLMRTKDICFTCKIISNVLAVERIRITLLLNVTVYQVFPLKARTKVNMDACMLAASWSKFYWTSVAL